MNINSKSQAALSLVKLFLVRRGLRFSEVEHPINIDFHVSNGTAESVIQVFCQGGIVAGADRSRSSALQQQLFDFSMIVGRKPIGEKLSNSSAQCNLFEVSGSSPPREILVSQNLTEVRF